MLAWQNMTLAPASFYENEKQAWESIMAQAKSENKQHTKQYSERFFENRDCPYFPCHEGPEDFNCLFCYCPLYTREDCPGSPVYKEKNGKRIKVCTGCSFPHRPENYEIVLSYLRP